MSAEQKECSHYWAWMHNLIQGRRFNSVVIVRQCDKCKLRQMAEVQNKDWHHATGDYKRDEHYR